MARLLSSRKIISILETHGFEKISQRGSHIKFQIRNDAIVTRTVIVPANRKEIPHGTMRSIIRQSGLSDKLFST